MTAKTATGQLGLEALTLAAAKLPAGVPAHSVSSFRRLSAMAADLQPITCPHENCLPRSLEQLTEMHPSHARAGPLSSTETYTLLLLLLLLPQTGLCRR
jgi:hypothetical protein